LDDFPKGVDPMQPRLILIPLATLAAIAMLTSACGGKSAAPGIASLTTTGTTATTTTSSGGSLVPNSAGVHGGQAVLNMGTKNGPQFAACMRKNGVPNFPDPSSTGEISIGPSSGIDPGSPKFQSAQQKCRKLLPNGGQPTPAQIAKAQQSALDFSKCMRAHGVTKFPDPTFSSGGGIGIKIGSKGGGLDPNNPTFKAAQQACQGHLLFGKGGGTTSSAGAK
jgi:hypothetical protein